MPRSCQNKKRPLSSALLINLAKMETALETTDLMASSSLKKRSDLHLARKIWHVSGVTLIAMLYASLPQTISQALIVLAWLMFVPADFLRLRHPQLNQILVQYFRPIMRQSELQKLAGTSYLLTGLLIITFLFPAPIVLLAMFFLAFADPIASYFGIRFGKEKLLGEKSLQGFLAAFVVCSLLTFVFLNRYQLIDSRIVFVSILGGLIGALAELIPIGKLDDNLTLPTLSALSLWALFSLFGAVYV